MRYGEGNVWKAVVCIVLMAVCGAMGAVCVNVERIRAARLDGLKERQAVSIGNSRHKQVKRQHSYGDVSYV